MPAHERFHDVRSGQSRLGSLRTPKRSAGMQVQYERAVVETPPFRPLRKTTPSVSEGEPARELNHSSGCGCCNRADTGGRSPAQQRGVTEHAVRIIESCMVEDVVCIHPNLDFASLPSGDTETLGQ